MKVASSNKMKLCRSKNVFDSFKFILLCNKLSGYLFFTVDPRRFNKFSSRTALLDCVIFAVSLLLTSSSFIAASATPVNLSMRSTIMEIGDFLFSRFIVLHPIITILLNFYFRHEWFKILDVLHRIDIKV